MLSAIHVPELFMISPTMLLSNLGARDRTLFLRCALVDSSRRARFAWTMLTHVGGATCTVRASMGAIFSVTLARVSDVDELPGQRLVPVTARGGCRTFR